MNQIGISSKSTRPILQIISSIGKKYILSYVKAIMLLDLVFRCRLMIFYVPAGSRLESGMDVHADN